MIAALCHRIEAARAEDKTLDSDILHALTFMPAFEGPDFVLRHAYGLAGNLTGVVSLLEEMLPNLRWDVQNRPRGSSLCIGIVDCSNGTESPHVGASPVAANALLAAGLRAYAGVVQAPVLVAGNDDAPAFFGAANDGRRAEA